MEQVDIKTQTSQELAKQDWYKNMNKGRQGNLNDRSDVMMHSWNEAKKRALRATTEKFGLEHYVLIDHRQLSRKHLHLRLVTVRNTTCSFFCKVVINLIT